MAASKIDLAQPATFLEQKRFEAKLADAGIVDGKHGHPDGVITVDEIDHKRLPGGMPELQRVAGADKVLQPREVLDLRVNRPLREQHQVLVGADPVSRADARLDDVIDDMQGAATSLRQLSSALDVLCAAYDNDKAEGNFNNPETDKLSDKADVAFYSSQRRIRRICRNLEKVNLAQDLKFSSDARLAEFKAAMTQLRDLLTALERRPIEYSEKLSDRILHQVIHETEKFIRELGPIAERVGIPNWPAIAIPHRVVDDPKPQPPTR